MKNFIKSFLIVCLLIIINSCSKNENVTDKSEEIDNDSVYGVSMDPSNPLIFKTFSGEGEVSFFGEKNADGTAISVDYVTVKVNEYEEPVFIELEENGKPKSILTPNGESIRIEWLNNSELKIFATDNSGNWVHFLTDLNNPLKEGDDITFFSKKPNIKSKEESSKSSASMKANVNNLKVKLSLGNNSFNDASVIVLAKGLDEVGNNMDYQTRYMPASVNNGEFSFSIQKPKVEGINYSAICSSAESILNEICNYVDPLTTDAVFAAQSTTWLCSQIALAFNVAGLPAYATCEVLTKSLVLYCSTLGASPAPGAPNLAQAICVGIKSVLPKQYRFSAAIYVNGGGVYRADENTAQNVSGPFNDILFDLPIEELIRINKRKILGTWKAVLYNQKPADGSYSQVYMGGTCPNLISQETGWNYAFYSFNPYNNLTHSNEYIIKQYDYQGANFNVTPCTYTSIIFNYYNIPNEFNNWQYSIIDNSIINISEDVNNNYNYQFTSDNELNLSLNGVLIHKLIKL